MIEQLISLGFEHSQHLSKAFSYTIQGSELKIRDEYHQFHISYFDDEIDDILQ